MKKSLKLLAVLAASGLMVGCNHNSPVSSPVLPNGDSPSSVDSTSGNGSSHTPDDDTSAVKETTVSAKKNVTGNLDAKGKFYADYTSLADEQAAAKKTAIAIAEEGDVLLKNENNALPLSESEKSVTLLGMHSVSLITAGGGSGSGTTGNNGVAYTGLPEALEKDGYEVNPATIHLYQKYKELGTVSNELPMDKYTSSVYASYYAYDGAAILTFSRVGTENSDLKTHSVEGHKNVDDHILMLDDNEKELVKQAKQYFRKVIVLINSSNIMEIPELAEKKSEDNYGVDAILWIGGVGNNGTEAIGKILDGTINPSGHTSDIWTKDFKKDPSWTNFGFNSQNKNPDGSRMNAQLYREDGSVTNFSEVEYREGIYNGYKYYETKANDMGDSGEGWYRDNVLYPFGYGLSYTTFDWKLVGVKKEDKISAANQTITVKVEVTNTGEVAGKDVVQLYYSAPYTKGGIEKASNNLINFAKTKLLRPGESDVVTIGFVAQDMASFDYNDANKNNFKGYELEAGDYTITANRDSHTPVLSVKRTIDSGMTLRQDYITGNDIHPIFSNDDRYLSTKKSYDENKLSRSQTLSQPKPASVADRTISEETYETLQDQDVYHHYEIQDTDPYYVASVPADWKQDEDNHLLLSDMAGVDYEDLRIENGAVKEGEDAGSKKWTQFMNQLSWKDMCTLVAGDSVKGPGSQAIEKIGKTADGYSNGPVQYAGGTLFPSAPIIAATYNTELAHKMGRLVGNEAIFLSNNLWAGPAMNLHRSPFGGRNFEYYSQDGWHSARIVAEVIKGAVSKGTITLMKHFFLNDQESYRADYGGVLTFVDEQTMRESYLKPFEWASKVGHSNGVMSSFNRIGYEVTATSYAVNQYLLRDEWGSKAVVSTDAWAKDYVPINLLALSGGDQLDGTAKGYAKNALDYGTWDSSKNMVLVKENESATEDTLEDPSLYFGIRSKMQRALYNRANSISNHNGAVAGKNFEITLEKGVNNNVQITNEDASFTLREESATSTAVKDALAEKGLKLVSNTVISGTPKEEGDLLIPVNYSLDGWVTSSANLLIHIRSAIHVNGKAMETGVAAASFKAGEKVSMKVDIPALSYFTEIPNGRFSNLIVNSYKDKDGSWKQRDEDKTAADIITTDASTAVDKREYAYAIKNLPEGLTAKVVSKSVLGKANRSSYEVPDYVLIEGTMEVAGDYSFDVDLTYYTAMYAMTWIFGSGEPRANHYSGTVSFHIA